MINQTIIKKATMENIQSHNGVVLLLLSGYRCPPCQRLKQILTANDNLELNEIVTNLEESTNTKVLFVVADVQKGELPYWFKESETKSIPTLVIIYNNKFITKYSPTQYINNFEGMCHEISREMKLYV